MKDHNKYAAFCVGQKLLDRGTLLKESGADAV